MVIASLNKSNMMVAAGNCCLLLQWAKDHGWGDPVAGVYFKVKHGQ